MTRKLTLIALAALTLTGCQKSIEDRAEKEATEYTRKYCPTPIYNNMRTDSLTFDRNTHTYTYYCTLTGIMDDAKVIGDNTDYLQNAIRQEIKESTNLKLYKDAGMSFRYVLRSMKDPERVLFEETVTAKDYQ